MRRSARTRRCSPISSAACSRTGRTPRSSTASPTRAWPWTNSSPIRSRSRRTIQPLGAPHERIALPRHLYGSQRLNSRGLDLSDERRLAELAEALRAKRAGRIGAPFRRARRKTTRASRSANPADHSRRRRAYAPCPPRRDRRCDRRRRGGRAGAGRPIPPNERAAILRHAADRLEELNDELVGLIVREAGKTYANAVGEVREACDFLRYYAAEAVRTLGPASPAPLGVVACISPWNFPLAIFTGQVAAALAAGNSVIAKPAEETPLIAAEAVRALHEAGVPHEALAFRSRRGRGRGGDRRGFARAGRRLHRLDAGRAADRTRARRPARPAQARRSR